MFRTVCCHLTSGATHTHTHAHTHTHTNLGNCAWLHLSIVYSFLRCVPGLSINHFIVQHNLIQWCHLGKPFDYIHRVNPTHSLALAVHPSKCLEGSFWRDLPTHPLNEKGVYTVMAWLLLITCSQRCFQLAYSRRQVASLRSRSGQSQVQKVEEYWRQLYNTIGVIPSIVTLQDQELKCRAEAHCRVLFFPPQVYYLFRLRLAFHTVFFSADQFEWPRDGESVWAVICLRCEKQGYKNGLHPTLELWCATAFRVWIFLEKGDG